MQFNIGKRRKQELSDGQVHKKLIRLWPGIIIVLLQWLIRFVIPVIVPDDYTTQLGVFGGLFGGLAIVIWWLFFSRAPHIERWGALVTAIVALVVTSKFIDKSIGTAMMGLMFIIYAIPVLSLAFVVWAVATRRLSDGLRQVTMVLTILLVSGMWALLRTNGMTGDARHDFAWRWAETAEDRLLAHADNQRVNIKMDSAAMKTEAEWPGFRGLNRDGIIRGIRIMTDWSVTAPVELWRRPVGPGCSSFAIHGNLFYTQEQRGEYETVSCYNLTTGNPVWKHHDKVRFYDSHAGAGPRATPTLADGRVFTLGATGIVNALDAGNGSVIWSRDAASETGVKVLTWGFTGSPLVVDDVMIISLSGKLAAYDAASGKPLWYGSDRGDSYSSPHLVSIGGVSQILLMSQSGALSVDPFRGTQLWKYSWPMESRILQPAVIAGGDLLLAGEATGVKRVTVSNPEGQWTVKERWKSTEMKLNFNDFIIHDGYAYGFDGARIACMDVRNGKCKWKGDRYRGWLLLLADQNLLLVLTEKGELALVKATPDQFTELARIPAITGKTWNHPALAGDILLIRNSQEMVAFRLSLAGA